jgi:hypothetical protein
VVDDDDDDDVVVLRFWFGLGLISFYRDFSEHWAYELQNAKQHKISVTYGVSRFTGKV